MALPRGAGFSKALAIRMFSIAVPPDTQPLSP
jgi:hypothetical protein